ncbi:MAG: nuclear transport factor 2 family protein [Alphaproteobacteria bacterium]|nr:MAG: nuclear transport factor 2 family protein [Alphaproteobacteria bacterium]
MNDLRGQLARYAKLYEDLSPETLGDLNAVLAEDVEFQDPFNHHHNRAELLDSFAAMFRKVPGARFQIIDYGPLLFGANTGVLYWKMFDQNKPNGGGLTFEGTTLVTYNDQGQVIKHIDHWDAASQFYERFPVIGSLIRFIKKRV